MSAQHTGLPAKSEQSVNSAYGAFAMRASPGDNLTVDNHLPDSAAVPMREPFHPGALVIATLCSPREKFWGMILALSPNGMSLSGAELASFEDLTVMVRDGEPFTPAVVFFPMHRIERVELDLPDGGLPSLSQRFFAKTGLEPSTALAPHADPQADTQKTANDPNHSRSRASQERA
jgi:hypothetical protein